MKTVALEHLSSVLLPAPDSRYSDKARGHPEATSPSLIASAVVVPIVLRETPQVLLTRRARHLKDHPGQICFPGGRVDPEDVSPAHTALREFQEETGVVPDRVEVIGYLPDRETTTGFLITPVVAFVRPPLALFPAAFEVDEIFEAPLAFLLDTANHCVISVPDRERPIFSISYQNRRIWGATAAILRELSERLFPAPV